jgi:uncharacterized glyoxalase superfamily protein PhnB
MAVVVIQEFEATPEEYDQVNEKLGDDVPEGAILHAACDLGGGRMRAVDVWESADAYQKFVQERLIPAIDEVSPDAPQAGEAEIRETYDLQQA